MNDSEFRFSSHGHQHATTGMTVWYSSARHPRTGIVGYGFGDTEYAAQTMARDALVRAWRPLEVVTER